MKPSPLKGRSCLMMADLSTAEIRYLLDLAHEVKRQKKRGSGHTALSRKNLGDDL